MALNNHPALHNHPASLAFVATHSNQNWHSETKTTKRQQQEQQPATKLERRRPKQNSWHQSLHTTQAVRAGHRCSPCDAATREQNNAQNCVSTLSILAWHRSCNCWHRQRSSVCKSSRTAPSSSGRTSRGWSGSAGQAGKRRTTPHAQLPHPPDQPRPAGTCEQPRTCTRGSCPRQERIMRTHTHTCVGPVSSRRNALKGMQAAGPLTGQLPYWPGRRMVVSSAWRLRSSQCWRSLEPCSRSRHSHSVNKQVLEALLWMQ